MTRALLALLLATACQSGSAPSSLATDAVELGGVSLLVPAGWTPTVSDDPAPRQIWVPADNPRKESLAVRVTPRDRERSVDDLVATAMTAQGQLASAEITRQDRITSLSGLPGVWIDLTYTPPNATVEYARTHVVLVAEEHVVHLLYTAVEPEPERQVVRVAMDSVVEEG